MQWIDQGIILSAKRHGESSAIVNLLTREHGRHLGLVQGANSRSVRGLLQPGNLLRATWRARLSEHLGTYTLEADTCRNLFAGTDAAALEALTSLCVVASRALPEREPHPAVFEGLNLLVSHLGDRDVWLPLFIRWELGLLQELGFALDLSRCAVTGSRDDLTHVSPKTGRAVCREEALPYESKLLRLPDFLLGSQGNATQTSIEDGFRLTGHFLESWVFAPHGQTLPDARERLHARLFR